MFNSPTRQRATQCVAALLVAATSISATAQDRGVTGQATAVVAQAAPGASSWFSEAFALLQKGEYAGASAAYRRGLEVDPRNVAAHYYFGRALDGMGNTVEARSHYEMAAKLGPATPEGEIAKNVLADIDEDRQAKVDPCW